MDIGSKSNMDTYANYKLRAFLGACCEISIRNDLQLWLQRDTLMTRTPCLQNFGVAEAYRTVIP
jgi:hypothetical protein